jgi:hypothetical protein
MATTTRGWWLAAVVLMLGCATRPYVIDSWHCPEGCTDTDDRTRPTDLHVYTREGGGHYNLPSVDARYPFGFTVKTPRHAILLDAKIDCTPPGDPITVALDRARAPEGKHRYWDMTLTTEDTQARTCELTLPIYDERREGLLQPARTVFFLRPEERRMRVCIDESCVPV